VLVPDVSEEKPNAAVPCFSQEKRLLPVCEQTDMLALEAIVSVRMYSLPTSEATWHPLLGIPAPVTTFRNGEAEKSLAPVQMLADAFSGTTDVTTSHTPGLLTQSRAPDGPVTMLPQLAAVPLLRR